MKQTKLALPVLLLVLILIAIWLLWPSSTEVPDGAGQGVSASATENAKVLRPEDGPDSEAEPEPEVIDAVSDSGVRMRIREVARVPVPKPPYLAHFQALRPDAEGADPISQYALGQMLYRCREVPADRERLKSQIDTMYQTREVDGWPVEDPELEAQSMRRAYEDCEGIPQEERLDFRQWMQRAAEAGLLEAQVNLMFHLPVAEYCQFLSDCSEPQRQMMEALREEARVQVGRALEAGSVDAMRTLGGWAINDEMGPVDPVEAWAQFSAYEQVLAATGEGGEVRRMIESLASQLRPVDLERAKARVDELLSNPNCCLIVR